MSRSGLKSVVYHGDTCLGELDVIPVTDQGFRFPKNEIRIHHISTLSERCPPLSILQTVASFSVRCKLEASLSPSEQAHLIKLHASCFYELKTAVVVLEDEEIHLVAMPSKQKKFPCFWCFSVPFGLYSSSMGLLNMRCLAIVFDLDETLIVANTMKSFENRIDALRSCLGRETDPMRIIGMTAELKRYAEDRSLLKQYIDNDCVMENGSILKAQMEEVPQSSDGLVKVFRPIVRLEEKNIVLTRIKPEIRDTSVLVRLRPTWENLRSYLIANGRKRFEVFVCTMAERDYALEMWRLLDPELNLITSRQLQDRVVCVKPGDKKSLHNVFQNGTCHPKMAMVIDDRSKVWKENDQPRVHVVPPFTPYYAPQAEMANGVPVLCVARNVACKARGYFFKDFNENLLRKISDIFYEDDVAYLPHAPDVSSYLIFEDSSSLPNGNPSAPFAEGMQAAKADRILNKVNGIQHTATDPMKTDNELRPRNSQASLTVPITVSAPMLPRSFLPSQKDLNFPGKEQDMRGRFLQFRNQSPSEPPVLSPIEAVSTHAGFSIEGDAKHTRLNSRPSALSPESDTSKFDKQQIQNDALASVQCLGSSLNPVQLKAEEVVSGHDQQKPGLSSGSQNLVQNEAGKANLLSPSTYIGVLQEIGRRSNSKVEFKTVVRTDHDVQFSVEVLFTGEKIGSGMGKTRKDAQQQAALNALCKLAEKYAEFASSRSQPLSEEEEEKMSDASDVSLEGGNNNNNNK